MTALFAWIGNTDLKATTDCSVGLGPIAQALSARDFRSVHLLFNFEPARVVDYVTWLKVKHPDLDIKTYAAALSSPTDFAGIYKEARRVVSAALDQKQNELISFHLSPGTPAMAAVWLMLANGKYKAKLIETSREVGLRDVEFPFNLAAEFVADSFQQADQRLIAANDAPLLKNPAFEQIIYRSAAMASVVRRAQRAAPRSIPVLIEGDTGTGKELFARAIHAASPRALKPFIAINCGAIPAELAESELFGHEKGAFTGAHAARAGHFEQADGGTLFLDEIAELPKSLQVKLLRVLQENEVVRVGASKPTPVNVRIIAATHRNLMGSVAEGLFREDLFYRLAVATLNLPALREREGDLGLLIDHLWLVIDQENQHELGHTSKEISVCARKALLVHPWPGNVRELLNTLRRLSVWADAPQITVQDVTESLLKLPQSVRESDSILSADVAQGIDLKQLIDTVKNHYIEQALTLTAGNKTRAAKLLGLPNYQTLNNWIKN